MAMLELHPPCSLLPILSQASKAHKKARIQRVPTNDRDTTTKKRFLDSPLFLFWEKVEAFCIGGFELDVALVGTGGSLRTGWPLSSFF